jgi:hypothetical protein
MTFKEEVEENREIMEYLANKFFGGKCAVTHKPYEMKGFTIHHLEERDGDVLARDYKKKWGKIRYRIHYLRDLAEQFQNDPTLKDRTVLIRNFVHIRLDHYRNGITKFSLEKGDRQRFCDVAMATKTHGTKGRAKA